MQKELKLMLNLNLADL